MPHFISSVQEQRELGVRFVAVSQGIDTDEANPAARLMLNMLAAFAEFERELIVERTMAGLARARRQGRVGGRPRLVCDRAMVERLRKNGMSLVKIAEKVGISKARFTGSLVGRVGHAIPSFGAGSAPFRRLNSGISISRHELGADMDNY